MFAFNDNMHIYQCFISILIESAYFRHQYKQFKEFYTCSSGLFSPSVNTKSPHYVYKTHSVSYLALDKHLILGSYFSTELDVGLCLSIAYSRLSLTQVLIMMYTDCSKFNMRRKTWQHRSCCGEKTSLFFMLWFIHHSWLDLILLPPSSCPVYFPQCNLLLIAFLLINSLNSSYFRPLHFTLHS